jgi:apolipoprotein N-acyltransferase
MTAPRGKKRGSAAPVRPTRNTAALRAVLPPALALFALLFIPWKPAGPTGMLWSWDLAATHYAEAIPAFLGPTVAVLLVIGALLPIADRTRDLLFALFGFLMLASGTSEAATYCAARGVGPLLLVAVALGAAGHRLRLSGEVPRLARATLVLSALGAIAHFLWPVSQGGEPLPRIAHLVGFALGATGGGGYSAITFEAMVSLFSLVAVASAVIAIWNRPAGRADRILSKVYAWGLPAMFWIAALPIFLHLPPSFATGYLSVGIAIAAATHVAVRGVVEALPRAARGEYATPEAHPFFGRLCLMMVSAALVFFSFPRFDEVYLTWFAFLPALFVITDVRPKRAFLWGWFMGIVTNTGGFYWITGLLVQFANMNRPVSFLLCLLLAFYNGLVFALWAYLTRKLSGRTRFPLALVSALAFTGVEFLLWELFPWYLGASQYLIPEVIQIADITGVPGITFLVAFVGSALHTLLRASVRREPLPRRTLIAAGAALAVSLVYGVVRIAMVESATAAAPKLKIGVVQSNLRIKEPPQSTFIKLKRQTELARGLAVRGADLVVLPESALPLSIPKRTRSLPNVVRDIGAPLLFGASSEARVGGEIKDYNTAFLVDRDGALLGMYDKNYLLLFGEYVPYIDRPWMSWLKSLLPYATFLTPGEEVEVFPFRGHRLGVMICYEDILPAFTRRLAGKDPQVLLNLTNDAWFGKTSEPYHHMALSIFRAVENRLFLVRSVRTGVSGYVDAAGRIYRRSEVDTESAMLEEVALLNGTTFYREAGDVFAYLVLAGLAYVLGEAVWRWRKEKRSRTGSV